MLAFYTAWLRRAQGRLLWHEARLRGAGDRRGCPALGLGFLTWKSGCDGRPTFVFSASHGAWHIASAQKTFVVVVVMMMVIVVIMVVMLIVVEGSTKVSHGIRYQVLASFP